MIFLVLLCISSSVLFILIFLLFLSLSRSLRFFLISFIQSKVAWLYITKKRKRKGKKHTKKQYFEIQLNLFYFISINKAFFKRFFFLNGEEKIKVKFVQLFNISFIVNINLNWIMVCTEFFAFLIKDTIKLEDFYSKINLL